MHGQFAGLVLAMMVGSLLSACGDPTGHGATLRDLEVARSHWAVSGPSGYEVRVWRSCECLPETTGPVTIRAADGLVESRVYTATGQPVDARYAEYFPTVEGIFDLIGAAAREGAARVEAEYHPALGYPIRVFIDRQREAVDDEVTYRLSNFQER